MPDCVSEASDLGSGKPRRLGHEKPLVSTREGICSSAMQEEESVCHFLGEEKVCAMKRSGDERKEEKDRSIDEHMCERVKCRGSTVGGDEVYCLRIFFSFPLIFEGWKKR